MRHQQARAASKVEFVRALLAPGTVSIRAPDAPWVDSPLLAAATCAGFVEGARAGGARLFLHRKRHRKHVGV